MTTEELARRFVALCQEGRHREAGETFWSPDIVSIEPMGPMPRVQGLEALRGKHDWWENSTEQHGGETFGPYVNGDQFAVRFTLDATMKDTGQRMLMDEIGLYTVKDGKITEERFFYAPPPG